jgi:glycosyltransferase involved in cell wall biosynthesis
MITVNIRNLCGHTTGVQRYTKKILDSWLDSGYIFNEISPVTWTSSAKGHLWEQTRPLLSNSGVLWSPSNSGPILKSNQVVTIHDVVPLEHPEWLNKRFADWYKFMLPKLANNVDHIITISEFSKERICHYLKVPDSKVSVVYNGVDFTGSHGINDTSDSSLQLPFSRYVLSVCSLEPRKNLGKLIEAWRAVKNSLDDDFGLVIVGAKGVSRVFSDDALIVNEDDRIFFCGHVSDDDLAVIYSNASAFCYVSIYEGFGLPPLEAIKCRIPTLTSNTTSMKELCEHRAVLVDPLSTDSIADGILSVVKKPNQEFIEAGFDFSNSLTWHKCAEITHSIISQFE